jgi:hypothetical protein
MFHSRILPTLAVTIIVLLAAGQAPATTGATVLGAGFSGKPFALDGDVVIETIGLYESIRNYEDAANPTWLSWYGHHLDGVWRDLIHRDGLVVALRDSVRPGLEIVDVSDPRQPAALASLEANYFTSAWLDGGALVVSEEQFLLIYDLADPTAPTFAGFRLVGEHAGSRWFSAVDDVLYMVDGGVNLRAMAVADPLDPEDLGLVALAGDRIDALVAGDGALYVLAADDDGLVLRTLGVSEPLDPIEIQRDVLADDPAVAVTATVRRDQLLIIATSDGRVHAFDLAEPGRPVRGFVLDLPADHLAVSDHQLFLMAGNDVHILARGDGAGAPGDAVVRTLLPRLRALDGDGPISVAQLHADPSVLIPVDARNPRHPRLGEPFDAGVDGAFYHGGQVGMLVTLAGRAQLVDLSDPLAPDWLGLIDSPRVYFFRAAVDERVALLETGSMEVEIRFYDLTDPMRPLLRAKVSDYGLESFDGDLMVCSRTGGIRVYDVSDLWQPRYARGHPIEGSIQDVRLHQQHAYVLFERLNGSRAVEVVRLTDPSYPETVAVIELDHVAYNIDAYADRLWVYGYHICQIVNVADPAQPTMVAEFPSWGHTGYGLGFNGDVTTMGGWLISMRDDSYAPTSVARSVPSVASVRLEPAYPNPLNPSTTIAFTLGRAQELTVSIHDVRGRRIAELARGGFDAGRHTLTWTGEDHAGRPVASGVYLVRLHGAGLDASGTVTVVK